MKGLILERTQDEMVTTTAVESGRDSSTLHLIEVHHLLRVTSEHLKDKVYRQKCYLHLQSEKCPGERERERESKALSQRTKQKG